MNRSAFASPLVLIFCAAVSMSAFAQAQPAAPTTAAPPAKAKFATPLKGKATLQVIPGTSKIDLKNKEIVTTYKVKNMSTAPIALLKVDEYWYEKGQVVSTDTQRHKQPFQPGEVIEITTHSPATSGNASGWQRRVQFSHANGQADVKSVTKF
jgi:hypothetical protein